MVDLAIEIVPSRAIELVSAVFCVHRPQSRECRKYASFVSCRPVVWCLREAGNILQLQLKQLCVSHPRAQNMRQTRLSSSWTRDMRSVGDIILF